MMYQKFFKRLGHAIYNGGSSKYIPDSDSPTCPRCGNIMEFHGDDMNLEIGEEYWICPECDFIFGRDEVDPYIVPNDD